MFDFMALSPEFNSTQIRRGAGSKPLHDTAAGWLALWEELNRAEQGLRLQINTLQMSFQGPASHALAIRITPYINWLNLNAMTALRSGQQVVKAAASYDRVCKAMVPEATIVKNRAAALTMKTTNIFGQFTTKIADLDHEYQTMWAQNAEAMMVYRNDVLAVVAATPSFTSPPSGLVGDTFPPPPSELVGDTFF
ncbi:PPE family protein, partial [Mycobacterium haemophilum]|uniref:PPE family protein n=1 Tax=Mycobacterium haemophilum TaxID=29311 RepID=UPI000AAD28EE